MTGQSPDQDPQQARRLHLTALLAEAEGALATGEVQDHPAVDLLPEHLLGVAAAPGHTFHLTERWLDQWRSLPLDEETRALTLSVMGQFVSRSQHPGLIVITSPDESYSVVTVRTGLAVACLQAGPSDVTPLWFSMWIG